LLLRFATMTPEFLPSNQFPHFYPGGRTIERFRGIPESTENRPNLRVGSTSTRFGQATQGLSTLADGRLLRDAIAGDPEAWLGAEHVAAFGPELGVLVKLLDPENRLVVHVHPDRRFAAQHLNCRNGKTEAWIVLETASVESYVYVGFRENVSAETMRTWVDGQATDKMLQSLNALRVRKGDTVLVPAGVPHAIGGGITIVELQEPTDFSILMEWKGFDIDGPNDGHLGLGFDIALQAVDRSAWDFGRISRLVGPIDDLGEVGSTGQASVARMFPEEADAFFRAQVVTDGAILEPSVAILVVADGEGSLQTQDGKEFPVQRGDTLIVPHACGETKITGEVYIIRCLPPDPNAADPSGRPTF
jgi:mannose-6-phosphate isomerase